MTGPLASLKILDFSTLLPGPFATMLLADLGAEVVRVESPSRPDLVRHKPPYRDGTSAWHALLNRSKRSLTLDLKQPGAAGVVKRLVSRYDVLLEQFRPGVMERLGVDYETLRAVNPRLIYCALSGYGQSGPYRARAGHDINFLALAGIAAQTGRQGQGPLPLPLQLADVGAGSFGAILGLLAAAIHREQTGEGQLVDVSMLDGALAWNGLAIADTLASGEDPARERGLLDGGSYYDYYETSDGRYLSVGSLEPKFWQAFCQAIERPDLIARGYQLSPDEQQALKLEIQKEIGRRRLDEWTEVFSGLDACVEPVLSPSEATIHPQVVAREMLVEVPLATGGFQPQVAHPIKFSRTPPVYRHTGVTAGAHNDEILREIGYETEEIEGLQVAGILG